jgi:siroheme synthase (precorrin-2 oxidase/ferrochelatase)
MRRKILLSEVDIGSVPIRERLVSAALRKAVESFLQETGIRVVILITDGEDTVEDPSRRQKKRRRRRI